MVNMLKDKDPEEIYEVMADELGIDMLNEQIVRYLDEDTLIDMLEYVARINCIDLERYLEEPDDADPFSEERLRQ